MTKSVILFNKPYQCLTQFSCEQGRDNLSNYIFDKGFYPAGRLDYDSEGLLLLTDDGPLQQRLSNPIYKLPKTYLAQVEGGINNQAIKQLQQGVMIKTGMTQPAVVSRCKAPSIWDRTPPIRFRKNVLTSWVKIQISEGKNRQVRKMLASVGFPCLRLIRRSIGDWGLLDLQPGQSKKILIKKRID